MLSGVEIWPKVQWALGQQQVEQVVPHKGNFAVFFSDSLTAICQFSVRKQSSVSERRPSSG